jgi:hypothetical protein
MSKRYRKSVELNGLFAGDEGEIEGISLCFALFVIGFLLFMDVGFPLLELVFSVHGAKLR